MIEIGPNLVQLYNLPPSEVTNNAEFRQWASYTGIDSTVLLSQIPILATPPHRPLHLFYTLLTHRASEDIESWPPGDLVYHYARLVQTLPRSPPSIVENDISLLSRRTEALIKNSYTSISQFIRSDSQRALCTDQKNRYISYRKLNDLIQRFVLPQPTSSRTKPLVIIALPSGPLLTAICVAVAEYYTATTLSPDSLLSLECPHAILTQASFVLTTSEYFESFVNANSWIAQHGIQALVVEWAESGEIIIIDDSGHDLLSRSYERPRPNRPDDVAFLALVDKPGTSADVVSITSHGIITSAFNTIYAWNLNENDICVNMTDIYYSRDILTGLFATILSGGSFICTGTNPGRFSNVLNEYEPTWFFATNLIHRRILAEAPANCGSLVKPKIRFVWSIDATLPYFLACLLRETFHCQVALGTSLESYPFQERNNICNDFLYQNRRSLHVVKYSDPACLSWRNKQTEYSTGSTLNAARTGCSHLTLSSSELTTATTSRIDFLSDEAYMEVMTSNSGNMTNRVREQVLLLTVESTITKLCQSPETDLFERVNQVLAFTINQGSEREVIGMVLVPAPRATRPDLHALHMALQSTTLNRSEWPGLIIYADSISPMHYDNLRRILSERCRLPILTEKTPYINRHWEIRGATPTTAFATNIDLWLCKIEPHIFRAAFESILPNHMRVHCKFDLREGTYEAFVAPKSPGYGRLSHGQARHLSDLFMLTTHDYMKPRKLHLLSSKFPEDENGYFDETQFTRQLLDLDEIPTEDPVVPTKHQVIEAFAGTLDLNSHAIPHDKNFFQLGGDASKAEKLLSTLRAVFRVEIPLSLMAGEASIDSVTVGIEALQRQAASDDMMEGCSKLYSSTNPLLLALQLFPLLVFYPMRRSLQWTMNLYILSRTRFWENNEGLFGRLFNVVLANVAGWAVVQVVFPIIGIFMKWTIMGRYREGIYPMWGPYHTRWWLVQKITSLSGLGFFDLSDFTRNYYHRMMGAKIGRNAKLAGVELGEWDLLNIQDNVKLTSCVCRPFAAEGNTSIYLGPITIGENSSVAVNSVIAPNTEMPPYSHINANSSSWDSSSWDHLHAAPAVSTHDCFRRRRVRDWSITILLTGPIWLSTYFCSMLPWLGALSCMMYLKPKQSDTPLRIILNWYQGSPQVAINYLAVMFRVFFTPLILLGLATGTRTLFNLLFTGTRDDEGKLKGHLADWRESLTKIIFPDAQFLEINDLIGQNHKARSSVLRGLGAKVGKHVCWPQEGPYIGDYHLLEIGSNVTFGFNCSLITSDNLGSQRIIIHDGATVSDQVCVMPGVELGEGSTLDFGAATRRGMQYPSYSLLVGCRDGDAVPVRPTSSEILGGQGARNASNIDDTRNSDETILNRDNTLRVQHHSIAPWSGFYPSSICDKGDSIRNVPSRWPFHLAFYDKRANYYVLSPMAILTFSAFMTFLTSFFWNVPPLTSIQLASRIFYECFRAEESFVDPLVLYALTTSMMSILITAFTVTALGVYTGAKWLLVGRFKEGVYDWVDSSYCQRFQILNTVEKLIRRCFMKRGILSLLTGTHWLVWYYRALGAKIGDHCAIYANGNPSHMITEPDLIQIGDRVSIDDVGIISHTDIRGRIELARINIGDRCVLRSGSVIMSGAVMKNDSVLLENTLVMPQMIIREKWTMQRRPAERFYGQRVRKSQAARNMESSDTYNAVWVRIIPEKGNEIHGVAAVSCVQTSVNVCFEPSASDLLRQGALASCCRIGLRTAHLYLFVVRVKELKNMLDKRRENPDTDKRDTLWVQFGVVLVD